MLIRGTEEQRGRGDKTFVDVEGGEEDRFNHGLNWSGKCVPRRQLEGGVITSCCG